MVEFWGELVRGDGFEPTKAYASRFDFSSKRVFGERFLLTLQSGFTDSSPIRGDTLARGRNFSFMCIPTYLQSVLMK